MPELLAAYLTERLNRAEIDRLEETCRRWVDGVARIVVGAMAFAARVQEREPADAYREFFIDQGVPAGFAGGLASLTVSIARHEAANRTVDAKAVKALRYLAKGGRLPKPRLKHLRALIDCAEQTSFLDDTFRNPRILATEGGPYLHGEFLHLVRREACGTDEGLDSDAARLEEIAAILVPTLGLRRGGRTRVASIAHERVLGMLAEMGKSTRYTWRDPENDFTDAATRATRRQFGNPKFNPRPACRRHLRSGVRLDPAGSAMTERAATCGAHDRSRR